MNKKSLFTMLGALALIGVIGVGATLAYLSDSTGAITNKFTFTDKGIDITLDEAEVDENNKAKEDGSRVEAGENAIQEYNNLLPGMVVDKDPTVTVNANSANCNVFVSVMNANNADVLAIDSINQVWVEVDPADYDLTAEANTKYYVYAGTKANGTIEAGDSFKVVATSAADVVLEDVFETVTVGTDVTAETEFSDIVIKAAAVQADSCADADAAKTALGMLINN